MDFKGKVYHFCELKVRAAPSNVFCISMAMVIGPTPPGTGVICDAFCLASAKLTSPTSLYPRLADESCTA